MTKFLISIVGGLLICFGLDLGYIHNLAVLIGISLTILASVKSECLNT